MELHPMFISAIIGLFLVILWEEGIKHLFRKCKNKRKYSKYEGCYLAFNKYQNDFNVSNAFHFFELKRNGNNFLITNGISMLGHPDFHAQISLSLSNPNDGTGYYQHEKNLKDQITRFGFLEIQLAGNSILCHETIYNEEGDQNSDAYIWMKQKPKDCENIRKKSRDIQEKNAK